MCGEVRGNLIWAVADVVQVLIHFEVKVLDCLLSVRKLQFAAHDGIKLLLLCIGTNLSKFALRTIIVFYLFTDLTNFANGLGF